MRGFIFVLALVFTVFIGKAQDTKNAIGLRLGGDNGIGTEISFQHSLSDLNRLEFNLGTHNSKNYNAWGFVGLYQWVWNIDGNFNWYAGAGGRIGSWTWDTGYKASNDSGIFLSAVGNVGIEYSFPIGIQLSLDARPELGLINHGDAYNTNIALSVRYRF